MNTFIKSTLAKLKWIALACAILVFGYPVGYFVLDSTQPVAESDNSPKAGVGVYVINLDRSKERYAYVKDNIHALGFPVERVPGIDGAALSEQEISEKVDLQSYKLLMGHPPKRGMIGCYLSHLKAWKAFLDSHFEYAIIFEDDIRFDAGKLRPVVDDLTKSHQLWDVVNIEVLHGGTPLTLKSLTNEQKLAVYLTEVTHAGGYILNRKAVTRLLENALRMKMPPDHYFTRSWEFGLKFTGIENPRLVHQTFGDSETEKTQALASEKLTSSEWLQHSLFKLQSYAIRFFYNLKVYLISPSA